LKFYIGQTIQKLSTRKYTHETRDCKTSAIHNAIQKYGKENFKWEVIDEADNIDVLNMLERLHISRYESLTTQWGYNIREGGSGGKHSEETIKKMSEIKMGKNNPRYGKKNSLKSCKKVSDSHCKKYPSASFQRDRNPEGRCWKSRIRYKGHHNPLGYYEDPISASLVYNLVKKEIYKELEDGKDK
jgi:group I intron endonuclease